MLNEGNDDHNNNFFLLNSGKTITINNSNDTVFVCPVRRSKRPWSSTKVRQSSESVLF